MSTDRRLMQKVARLANAGVALLRSTAYRPPAPLKVNFALTFRCQYRCRTCRVWQFDTRDELTTDEVISFIRRNPSVTWADLTGGEIFLRPDIDDILDAVVSEWPRLALLHFPTNGFLTDRIVHSVERIARRAAATTIVTVSVDGDERTNDEIRGVKGGFRRQIDTFKALRCIRGITAVLGMTLSSHNETRFAETFDACAREIPGLTPHDFHLNVAQVSRHYYGNEGIAGVGPDAAVIHRELRFYRQWRGRSRSPAELLESAYLKHLEQFIQSGAAPVPCHALRAGCFVDPHGIVYPCISYAKPVGRLRDTGMRLSPIWNGPEARRLQREIWNGDCPQCWTACEAYQSILSNVLAGGRGRFRRGSGLAPVAARVPEIRMERGR